MSSEKYLLNVRNPQFLGPVYKTIGEDPKTEEEIQEHTQLPEDALEETLAALRLYGVIEKRDFEYSTKSFSLDNELRNPFRLNLLYNVSSQRKQDDEWSKKAAIPLVYAYLLKENIQYFKHSDTNLSRKIDNYHVDELQFEPKSSQGRQELKKEKLNNWAKQARFLGLIHKARGAEYTVYLNPSIVLDAIELAFSDCPHVEESTVSIEDFIGWLDNNILHVPFEDSTVPTPIARTLFILARNEEIELTRAGDPGSVNVQGIPTHLETVRERTNSIHLLS